MQLSWRGLSERTACRLSLIPKVLSTREPDKQHYYYHQSLDAEETEAAEGRRLQSWLSQWEKEGAEEVAKTQAAGLGCLCQGLELKR